MSVWGTQYVTRMICSIMNR